jgi:desulfoferrodoxin (superoxide reductase-like protein)
MKTYVCKVCGHIAFDQAPIDCPVCRAPIENFENNNEAIKMPQDPKNLSEMEKKHIPFITTKEKCDLIPGCNCTNVTIRVGEIEHIMESEHYITFIDTYINRGHLARFSLTYKKLRPIITLHLNIRDNGVFTAVANDNRDGNWMAEINL